LRSLRVAAWVDEVANHAKRLERVGQAVVRRPPLLLGPAPGIDNLGLLFENPADGWER
jgi:hypothetical protein